MLRRQAVLFLLAIAALSLLPGDRPGPRVLHPRPLERAPFHSEAELRQGRLEWQEELHAAAPGTDWRALERVNSLTLQAERAGGGGEPGGRSTSGTWTEVGSRNLAGRMHCATLSATGDSLYGGSSRGGVWKADRNGQGWRPLGDNLYGGAHGIAVAAGPPETITRITDDGLVHWTDDGGATWHEPAGPLADITSCVRVSTDPASPNRVYFLANKSGFRRLYLSEDGGRTYVRIRNLGPAPGDFWIDRRVGGRVWLLEGDTLLFTDDQGGSWNPAGAVGAPTATDVVLAGSEGGAPHFYAAMHESGTWRLHRSSDGGSSWDFRHTITDFWRTLEASITDPDRVLYGGVECFRSTDGGAAFSLVNGWAEYYGDPLNKLHADLPGMNAVWTPDGSEILYIATDGGLYRSDDGAATVTNISLAALRVSQYYDTHTSVNDPDIILAGSQDQGYQRSTEPGPGTGRDFEQLISGDYGHLTSGDGTHQWVFSVYPGFVLVQRNEDTADLIAYLDFPAGSAHSWMPFVRAAPVYPKNFYFCGDRLYRYTRNFNNTWTITPSAQDFRVHGGSYLSAFAISDADPDRRLAVTNSGVPWWSGDGGGTWAVSADGVPDAHYFYGTTLEFEPGSTDVAWAGGSGYSNDAAFRTTDGGATWSPAGDGLPPTLIYELAFEGTGSGALYAATEAGPYRRDPGSGSWSYVGGTDAPITTYWSVEAVPAAGVMRFGTYGRGIWDFAPDGAVSAGERVRPAEPAGLRLTSSPNPFRGSEGTTLQFVLERAGVVRLDVHDVTGRRVRALEEQVRAAGTHRITWDGRDDAGRPVAGGTYFATLKTGDGSHTRKLVHLDPR